MASWNRIELDLGSEFFKECPPPGWRHMYLPTPPLSPPPALTLAKALCIFLASLAASCSEGSTKSRLPANTCSQGLKDQIYRLSIYIWIQSGITDLKENGG